MAGTASAQSFVQYQHLFDGGRPAPTIDAQIMLPGDTIRPFFYLLATDGLAEALLGVSGHFRPWFGGAVAGGIEANEAPWRVNATVWLTKGRFFALYINEAGGSGHWYKFTTTARFGSRTSVGVLGQAFFGWGPLVEVGVGRGFRVWGAVTKGPETLVGIRRTF